MEQDSGFPTPVIDPISIGIRFRDRPPLEAARAVFCDAFNMQGISQPFCYKKRKLWSFLSTLRCEAMFFSKPTLVVALSAALVLLNAGQVTAQPPRDEGEYGPSETSGF